MKKVYCDRCGKEVEQNGNILLRKTWGRDTIEEYFDICDTCREAFFGWLNGAPAEQEKPVKIAYKPAKKEAKKADKPADKPDKKSAREGKSQAYTVQQIAEMSGAPVTTVRRHAEGVYSTYEKTSRAAPSVATISPTTSSPRCLSASRAASKASAQKSN